MRAQLFVLACLVCIGQSRKVKPRQGPQRQTSKAEHGMAKLNLARNRSPLLRLFLELNSQASFNPSGTANRAIAGDLVQRRVAASRINALFGPAKLEELEISNDDKNDEEAGLGPACKPGDRVRIQYIGRTIKDNEMFDSGTSNFKLGAGEVIKGWDQGIEGMRVGGFRTLRIPAELAYGEKGAPPQIPPNADLEFDCELTKITPPKSALRALYDDFNAIGPFILIIGIIAWIGRFLADVGDNYKYTEEEKKFYFQYRDLIEKEEREQEAQARR